MFKVNLGAEGMSCVLTEIDVPKRVLLQLQQVWAAPVCHRGMKSALRQRGNKTPPIYSRALISLSSPAEVRAETDPKSKLNSRDRQSSPSLR